ncbi:MAG TPA: PEPxxWA-CTERM sorting domain-containing protein [Caulobacteraceae bacterium]
MKLFNLLALSAIAGASLLSAANAAPTTAYMFGFTPSGSQQLVLNGGAIVLNATATGWYANTGTGNGGSNYIVGNCSVSPCGDSGDGEYRDYFVFDLSNVDVPITSASLSIGNPSNGFGGSPADYTSWDVTTALASLTSGGGGLAAYGDLGSGVMYASTAVGAGDNGTQVSIVLDSAAITALNADLGSQFAIGGALSTTVPEPATWGLMLAGVGAVGFALRRRGKIATA